jgi:putative Holliday junction resolvase
MAADNETILALDVGAARIGMALANTTSRLPRPLGALPNDDSVFGQLRDLCEREAVTHIVVGLPRGMDGQDTRQTSEVRAFGEALARQLVIPLSWQDEAVTSVHAEEELQGRGKLYTKADIDALAAVYILEDYLA